MHNNKIEKEIASLKESLKEILYFKGQENNIDFFISSLTEFNPLNSTQEVEEWLKQLITNLDYIKAIDKKAGIKSDVNVSIKETNHTRIEIKNVNSITNIKNSIENYIHDIVNENK